MRPPRATLALQAYEEGKGLAAASKEIAPNGVLISPEAAKFMFSMVGCGLGIAVAVGTAGVGAAAAEHSRSTAPEPHQHAH